MAYANTCQQCCQIANIDQEVWETVVPLVNKAFDGYNVTLFTYGMTGSGLLSQMDSCRCFGFLYGC